MRRVSVVGTSGSGKTRLARELGILLDLPVVELDGIFHQPGWVELDTETFRNRVTSATSAECWIVDGNYAVVRDIVWGRADTVVWLDLPRQTVMRRVVLRTLRRVLTRQSLWNGNREPFANIYRFDDRNIIRWAWTTHTGRRTRYESALADSTLEVIRLRSAGEVRAWMRTLATKEMPGSAPK